ncbi:unnamed protein product, partial [Ixodes hexagonus]
PQVSRHEAPERHHQRRGRPDLPEGERFVLDVRERPPPTAPESRPRQPTVSSAHEPQRQRQLQAPVLDVGYDGDVAAIADLLDVKQKLYVLVHGFRSKARASWMQGIKNEILAV